MPIYEYVCENCGTEFELLQKIDSSHTIEHSCAKGSIARRKVSLNAFQLKGGGWYKQGYNSEAATTKPASTEKASASTKSDATASSAAKPASTASKPST